MTNHLSFSGSYAPEEVQFLITPIQLPDTPVAEKERLIQTGQSHYSQLLTHEKPPPEAYQALFHQALTANCPRMAEHIMMLAQQIIATRAKGITLVSLARAGTPVGVLLKHVLKRHYQQDCPHYSISILRDIGLDLNALRYILQRHAPDTLVFIDGWTGKGVIARQLAESLAQFASTDHLNIPAQLYVLADLSGHAEVAATTEDYLIPSCLLNATVSGLISRTVNRGEATNANQFHGCVYYPQLASVDMSRYFIETVLAHIEKNGQPAKANATTRHPAAQMRQTSQKLINQILETYDVKHHHYIKPGIGEATRVLLRREARLLIVQDTNAKDIQHLSWLAESRAVPITEQQDLPYRAVALIKEISK